tara:strand:- start:97 stop:360 length:264 start_codon:yes stop_codon:yes gene_type:complete
MFLRVLGVNRLSADCINEAAYGCQASVRGFGLYQVETSDQLEEIRTAASAFGLEVEEAELPEHKIKRPHLLRAHIGRASSYGWRWRL